MKFRSFALVLLLILLAAASALAEKAPLTPGQYEATVTARNGDLTVRITVSENAIESAAVVSHSETVGVADAAIECIPQDIVKAQSIAVDAYTGATITSRSIAYAVQKALEQAGGTRSDWSAPVSRKNITDEVKELVKKATAELDGAEYTPVAYLATQVVAGTNHLILCKKTIVVPDPVPTYALVTIYEDLQGNAELTDVIDSNKSVTTENESLEISDEAKTAFDKATETLTGAEYKPVALLSTATAGEGDNAVSYTEYTLLCKATPTVPNALPYYVIIDVNDDPNSGRAEIANTYEFIFPDTAEEEAQQDGASETSTAE